MRPEITKGRYCLRNHQTLVVKPGVIRSLIWPAEAEAGTRAHNGDLWRRWVGGSEWPCRLIGDEETCTGETGSVLGSLAASSADLEGVWEDFPELQGDSRGLVAQAIASVGEEGCAGCGRARWDGFD